jgi:hypothetical protein
MSGVTSKVYCKASKTNNKQIGEVEARRQLTVFVFQVFNSERNA